MTARWLPLLLLLATPLPALAEPAAPVVVLEASPQRAPEPRREAWTERVTAALRREGHPIVDDPVRWATARDARAGSVMPARARALERVERLLVRARRHAAALQERRALGLLARAARLAEGHADVPGAAAWIAEVYTAIGIVADQAGMHAVSEGALARAATLDESRGVRAAEAPPDVVRRAEAIARAVATRPTGRFVVDAPVPGARVFVDDELVGAAPARVRAPVGTHVLRVVAPGHLAWGRVIDVFEGERPSLRVALSPSPAVAAAQRLQRAGRRGDAPAVASALAALERDGIVAEALLLRVGSGPRDRALAVACDGRGCALPRRLDATDDAVPPLDPARATPAERARAIASARRWLAAPRPAPAPPPSWWKRWWVWAAAGVAVAAAGTTAGLMLRPSPKESLTVVVDPGEEFPYPETP